MRSLDSNGIYDVILDSDKDKEKPLTFHFKYLTLKNEAEFEGLNITLAKAKSKTESIERIINVLSFTFIGMSNYGGTSEIDPDDEIWDYITYDEAHELYEAILKANNPGLDLKKKSDSPSVSVMEPSAKDALFHDYAPESTSGEPESNALNVMEPGASNAMGQVV